MLARKSKSLALAPLSIFPGPPSPDNQTTLLGQLNAMLSGSRATSTDDPNRPLLITCNFGLRLLAQFGGGGGGRKEGSIPPLPRLIFAAIRVFCRGLPLLLSSRSHAARGRQRTRFYFLQDKTVVHKKATRHGRTTSLLYARDWPILAGLHLD